MVVGLTRGGTAASLSLSRVAAHDDQWRNMLFRGYHSIP
jgi:hypothetical protein